MNKHLTEGELKIIRALSRLEKLWIKEGKDLVLFNGQSLRKGGVDSTKDIIFFYGINGEGGDGGDKFEK